MASATVNNAKNLEQRYREMLKDLSAFEQSNVREEAHFKRFSIYKPTKLTYTSGTAK